MLKPSSENIVLSSKMLDQMVKYYKVTYVMYNFQKPFGEGPDDLIVISVKINKFGKCQIGFKIFRSSILS